MGKKSSAEGGKKKKSKSKIRSKLSTLNAESRKTKVSKENPFESIWSRRKFDVLGKKRKDEERRRVGRSRSLAVLKRQNTLLKEYQQSTKSSVFLDKRIGEQSEGLGEFDKAIMRSQRERQLKLKKKSKFNLSDGEDDFEFPDNGYPVRDDFEDEETLDEDEDGEFSVAGKNINLQQLNYNEAQDGEKSGSEGVERRPKSKKEVMEDIISKSKFFKAQKANEKEENEKLVEQLDKDFMSLVQSEALLSLTQPDKMKAIKALVNPGMPNTVEVEAHSAQNNVSLPQEKYDQYDKLVSEMALDMRARPSDRTKTPEELAQEEKDHLEHMEEERLKRMHAADDSSDEDGNTSEDDEKQITHISGDDLGDSFSHVDKSTSKVGWIEEILRRENTNNLEGEDTESSGESEVDGEDEGGDDDDDKEDEEHDEFDEENVEDKVPHSLRDWEQSDDDYSEINLKEEEDAGEASDDTDKHVGVPDLKNMQQSKKKQKDGADCKVKTKVKKDLDRKGELPYTIEAPKDFKGLTDRFDNLSDDQIVEAIRRIRTFNAVSIAAENRRKMQVFYGLLLQYFAVLANKKPLKFKLLNMLTKPLIEMSAETPYFAALCARQRLFSTHKQFCLCIKDTGKTCWPSVKTLFLLRLWSLIFPCSDFRHAVTTPAILLMSEYIMRCPATSGRDIAIGSFLCSMLLCVCRQSKKYCPEAISFIVAVLLAAQSDKQKLEASQLYHLMELKALHPLLHFQGQVKEIKTLDFLTLMNSPDDSPYFTSDDFRASILLAIIKNLKGFVNIYEELKSFPEIFLPVSKILQELAKEDHMPDALKNEIEDAVEYIENKSKEHHFLRQPLRIRKPKVIKTAVPKFEDNFVKGRDYDPDRERAERKKLKKHLKQEAKGAVRELRKDNYFLSEVKEKDKARMEEERAEQYGRHKAFLQEQEHAYKSGQLGKGKKRKK
ncbi:uncharacterized protein LOC127263530 [Andrographis paniculata]|uniref:uncharacterized protein LOC127263530 n=1 Tax=Andrographis paniculata TaxID=175694 RepID=UPI0021E74A36|nr:uncharacterized protein LOC127263530 [Andrographis paniculata]